jgi:quercetin dioxygenase-like cupin family protein
MIVSDTFIFVTRPLDARPSSPITEADLLRRCLKDLQLKEESMKFTVKSRAFKILIAVCASAVLATTAFAFATMWTYQGTVESYDFGTGFPVPGTVQIQALTFKPGDVVPWHFHKGLSYVILVHGNLTEQEKVGPNACGPINQFAAGTAFVETPGRIHTVTNPGPGAAIIYWATIFPKDDPDGPTTFVDPPNCN